MLEFLIRSHVSKRPDTGSPQTSGAGSDGPAATRSSVDFGTRIAQRGNGKVEEEPKR